MSNPCQESSIRGEATLARLSLPEGPAMACQPAWRQPNLGALCPAYFAIHYILALKAWSTSLCHRRKPEETGKQTATCSSMEANQEGVLERHPAGEASKAGQTQSSTPGAAVPASSHNTGKQFDPEIDPEIVRMRRPARCCCCVICLPTIRAEQHVT